MRLTFSKLENNMDSIMRIRDINYIITNCYPNHMIWFDTVFTPEFLKDKRSILYSEVDNRVAGFCLLKHSNENKICTLYVSPEFRGLGIGTKFVWDSIHILKNDISISFKDQKNENQLYAILTKFGFQFERYDQIEKEEHWRKM